MAFFARQGIIALVMLIPMDVLGAVITSLSHRSSTRAARAPNSFKMRLCNAYASNEALEMRRLQEPQLVEYPLPYKACHDYILPLQDGDQLQFRTGRHVIGTFVVRGLPSSGNMLLLVPHRRSPTNSALSFESHIFGDVSGTLAQIAVVDAYQYLGPNKTRIMISEDMGESASLLSTNQEELRYNSVVRVSPGSYRLNMMDGPTSCSSNVLTARTNERYVVMRVGDGKEQELVSYPQVQGSNAIRKFSGNLCWLASLSFLMLFFL